MCKSISIAAKWIKVKRNGFISQTDFRKALHSEWGLSLALESRVGADTRNLLLDFGYTPNALMNNMEIMGIDGTKMQGLIMSHGHFDHFGGLVGYLEKFRGKLPSDLTLYVVPGRLSDGFTRHRANDEMARHSE